MRFARCSEKYALKLGVQADKTAYSPSIDQGSGQPVGDRVTYKGINGHRYSLSRGTGCVLQLWGFGIGDYYRLYHVSN